MIRLASLDPSGRRWQSSNVGGSLAGRDGVAPAPAPLTAAGLPVRRRCQALVVSRSRRRRPWQRLQGCTTATKWHRQ